MGRQRLEKESGRQAPLPAEWSPTYSSSPCSTANEVYVWSDDVHSATRAAHMKWRAKLAHFDTARKISCFGKVLTAFLSSLNIKEYEEPLCGGSRDATGRRVGALISKSTNAQLRRAVSAQWSPHECRIPFEAMWTHILAHCDDSQGPRAAVYSSSPFSAANGVYQWSDDVRSATSSASTNSERSYDGSGLSPQRSLHSFSGISSSNGSQGTPPLLDPAPVTSVDQWGTLEAHAKRSPPLLSQAPKDVEAHAERLLPPPSPAPMDVSEMDNLVNLEYERHMGLQTAPAAAQANAETLPDNCCGQYGWASVRPPRECTCALKDCKVKECGCNWTDGRLKHSWAHWLKRHAPIFVPYLMSLAGSQRKRSSAAFYLGVLARMLRWCFSHGSESLCQKLIQVKYQVMSLRSRMGPYATTPPEEDDSAPSCFRSPSFQHAVPGFVEAKGKEICRRSFSKPSNACTCVGGDKTHCADKFRGNKRSNVFTLYLLNKAEELEKCLAPVTRQDSKTENVRLARLAVVRSMSHNLTRNAGECRRLCELVVKCRKLAKACRSQPDTSEVLTTEGLFSEEPFKMGLACHNERTKRMLERKGKIKSTLPRQ